MKLELIAFTTDGRQSPPEPIGVTEISVWIGRNSRHEVTDFSIKALVELAKITKRMQIYTGDHHKGSINALNGTPLYCNGETTVQRLELNGNIIWE